MIKQTIAVDIDDVLADTTDRLRLFVNEKFSLNLEAHHYDIKAAYWGYYEQVWAQNGIETQGLLDEFHTKYVLDQKDTNPIAGSQTAIATLASRYRLIAVSSRNIAQQDETEKWMKSIFNSAFKIIRCIDSKNTGVSKGEAAKKLGASFLIDDNVEHCNSAAEVGMTPILFGLYGWQHASELSEKAVRCQSWQEVLEYFNAK